MLFFLPVGLPVQVEGVADVVEAGLAVGSAKVDADDVETHVHVPDRIAGDVFEGGASHLD